MSVDHKENQEESIKDQKDEPQIDIATVTLCLSLTYLAYNLAWAIQIGQVTPYFERIQVAETRLSILWLAGPFSGLFFQPAAGFLSDYWGRRKPFVLIGGFCAALSLLIFSNSMEISYFFCGPDAGAYGVWVSQFLAAGSFFMLDISLNVVEVAIRSLVCDVIPSRIQVTVLSFTSGLGTGLGNLMGYALGAIPWIAFLPFFRLNIQPTFLLGVLLIVFGVVCTCITVGEKKRVPTPTPTPPQEIEMVLNPKSIDIESFNRENQKVEEGGVQDGKPNGGEENENQTRVNRIPSELEAMDREAATSLPLSIGGGTNSTKKSGLVQLMVDTPSVFYHAYAIQFLSYITKYTIYIYLTIFVGKELFRGDPLSTSPESRNQYDEGVRWCNLGFVLFAIVCALYVPILAYFSNRLKLMWCIGQFALGTTAICFAFVKDKYVLFLGFVFFGISNATMKTIPWSIVNVVSRTTPELEGNEGFISGFFNSSQCIPEFFVSLLGGALLYFFQGWGWGFGGLFFVAAFVAYGSIGLVLCLDPPDMDASKKKEVNVELEKRDVHNNAVSE